MTAQLTVGPATPVARPAVKLKVLSKKVDKVESSGKLKVKVTAAGQSDDVVLVAKKGARKLGSKSNVDVAAGSSSKVKLKLTRSGRKLLEDVAKAKVKVTATVPFGETASTKRKLH